MTNPDRKRTRTDDGNGAPPARRPRTRSQSAGDRAAQQAAHQAALDAEAALLRQRRNQAIANLPVAAPGNRSDGKLHIAFIQVGQGDCIAVSTPQGRSMVFDCGSTGTDGDLNFAARVRSVLRGVKFLGGTNSIDVLVLTHSDRDHYNQLETMFGEDFTVETCYHSDASDQYSVDYTSTWLMNHASSSLNVKQVIKNNDPAHGVQGEVSLNGQPVQPAAGTDTVDRLDGQGGIRIVDEPNCKISILAAGVGQVYLAGDGDPTNTASIVTLIEAFGKKVLLCGDATFNTEQYLVNTALNRVQNVTVMQIGHHASKVTSSALAFVRQVNPWAAVASAGLNIMTYHLPSKNVIVRYQNQLTASNRTQINEHETFFWDNVADGFNYASNWSKYQVFTTGSRGTVEFTFEAGQ